MDTCAGRVHHRSAQVHPKCARVHQRKGVLANGENIGAWLLVAEIPEYRTAATQATTLNAKELGQLLALKNYSAEDTKVE